MGKLPGAPPAALMSSGGWPLPFPRGLWEGRWAGPGVYEPQPLIKELILLLGFCGVVSTLLFLQSFTAFELSKLFGQMCFDI